MNCMLGRINICDFSIFGILINMETKEPNSFSLPRNEHSKGQMSVPAVSPEPSCDEYCIEKARIHELFSFSVV